MKPRPTKEQVQEANKAFDSAVEVLALETAYDFHDIVLCDFGPTFIFSAENFANHFFMERPLDMLNELQDATLIRYQELFGKFQD